MGTIILRAAEQTGPVPVSGMRAELLAEISQWASTLIKFVELERSGVYDGLGQDFWVDSDPILGTAKRLVTLAEQRISTLPPR